MRYFSRFTIALVMVLTCAPALAGFKFSIPGLGGGGDKGLDVGGLIKDGATLMTDVSEEEEIRIGQNLSAFLLGAKPLVADARIQRYVNTLGRWLAMQTERPNLPWVFAVLDDSGYNAFATPGGHIFVTQGLLSRMHNEAELAGVLAHEIGHVLKKHHLHAIKQQAVASGASKLVSSKTGNGLVASIFLDQAKKLYKSGLSVDDEYEADQVGIVIAARAGYDAYGLPAVLQLLQAQSAKDDSFSLNFATHPSPSNRLDRLGKLMQTRFDTLPASTGRSFDVRLTEFGKK